MSQYIISEGTGSSNRRNTPDAWNTDTVSDDHPQLLTWLSPLDPGLRHWDIQERRVNDVGGWLLETEEFRRWCRLGTEGEAESAVLFCYGNPGVGKTFIRYEDYLLQREESEPVLTPYDDSSLVVDRLCDQASGQNATVSCFYLGFAERKEQSATNVLGSLLKQIVSGMRRVPEEILRAFQQQKTTIGGRRPQLVDIVKMLQLVTSCLPTFVCLDALDECSRVQRARLLNSLKQVLEKSPGTRIFATGRPHIQAEIEKRLAGQVTSISVSPNRGDITRFLHVRLGEDEMLDAMDESLEADILEKIPENMSEMFRLVSLNIEAILRESTIYRRRERLSGMTDGLGWGDAYGTTIKRIRALDGDKSRLGMEALMWISHAERPLRVDELCHALAVELGTKDFNAGNAPSLLTLMSCCQGLIAVDKETLTVRLIHFTLQEYLSARPDLFNRPHSTMAGICLSYMNSELVKALSISSYYKFQEVPFLDYSARYWGVHAKTEFSDSTKFLAMQLFREYDSHISAGSLLAQVDIPRAWSFRTESDLRFSALHCASFFGIVELVTALIEMECYYINGRDCVGYTPLTWAARNGHGGVVRILLGREEVSTGIADNDGRTPLSYAAQGGHEGVVKILLARKEVSATRPSFQGRTPLSFAAQYGREGVVKTLLAQREVNPSTADNDDRTPLSHAAEGGHEGAVKILLEREEVNPGLPDNCGRTPLSYAAQGGDEGVVEALLGRKEVNPDKADDMDTTPLWWAAWNGHEGVVRILLEREEVNPDKADDMDTTPLWRAAWNGHEGVVKMLLARGEVNPNSPDQEGQTPLLAAIKGGREEVVKLLLARQEVNAGWPSYNGRTPLSCAAQSGSEGVVKILLERQDVYPSMPDDDGRTPLSYAAEVGIEKVVKILLARQDVNVAESSHNGRTPFSYAAGRGSERVVKILLAREEVAPDEPCRGGRTPLSYAAQNTRGGVVKILLSLEEVNPDKPGNDGRTPLSYAVEGGNWGSPEGVVRMLLGREEVNPDKPDNKGRTPLSWAAWHGHEGVVKALLGLKEVNPDTADNDGRTPLSHAMWGGGDNVAVVQILLGREEVSPDKPDCDGRTPLSWAAEIGREQSVKALLAREEVNPNKPDNSGRTPLMLAASNGHPEVTALLQPYITPIHTI